MNERHLSKKVPTVTVANLHLLTNHKTKVKTYRNVVTSQFKVSLSRGAEATFW